MCLLWLKLEMEEWRVQAIPWEWNMSEWEGEAFINLDKLEIEDHRKIDEGSKRIVEEIHG